MPDPSAPNAPSPTRADAAPGDGPEGDPDPRPRDDEAGRLSVIAAELARFGQRPDLTDDCAHRPGRTDLVSHDDLVEGRHFDLRRDTLAQVGAQAAVANLSDLAASGGMAGWLVWSLVLPTRLNGDAVRALTRGFASVASVAGARVIGGNLTGTSGPLVVSVTAGGPLAGASPITRRGAKPGEAVYVTGPLGDAALGVMAADPEARRARHAWRPHLREAARLAAWGQVGAMMDVSDGLLLDACRLARASGVALNLWPARVPRGPLLARREATEPALAELCLSGGEDYVLLFTAGSPPPAEVGATQVGEVHRGAGLWIDGQPTRARGYDHFAGGPR